MSLTTENSKRIYRTDLLSMLCAFSIIIMGMFFSYSLITNGMALGGSIFAGGTLLYGANAFLNFRKPNAQKQKGSQ